VIFLSVVLPLFSIVTDPGPAPYHAYNLVLALGTAVAAPVFFVMLVSSLRTLRDRWRAGLPMENEALIKQDGGERAAQAERAVRANTDR